MSYWLIRTYSLIGRRNNLPCSEVCKYTHVPGTYNLVPLLEAALLVSEYETKQTTFLVTAIEASHVSNAIEILYCTTPEGFNYGKKHVLYSYFHPVEKLSLLSAATRTVFYVAR